MRSRHFPFPLKVKQDPRKLKRQILSIFDHTAFLLHGGRNFEIKVGRTESMTAKEVIQNVMVALETMVSLVVWVGNTKYNKV